MFCTCNLCIYAQNSIDKMVESYSTIGKSTFTSAVDRDKATRKVNKVVNVLEISTGDVNKFIEAFEAEKSKCTSYKKTEDADNRTVILTMEDIKSNRIYILQYRVTSINNKYIEPIPLQNFKVSIIIKYN